MEWELVRPWVNRVGIMLESLAFWLAAPEILGEERLRALEGRVEQGLRNLPLMLAIAAVIALAWVSSMVTAAPFALITLVLSWREHWLRILWAALEVAGALALVMVAARLMLSGAWALEDKVVRPLLRLLADDERIRGRSLAVGAVLFVVGFLLQLIGTF